jgi:hypothetical protein
LTTSQFALAPGTAGYAGEVFTESFTARYFRIDGVTDWNTSQIDGYNGISEIRFNQSDAAVPEPSTFILAALGLAGLGVVVWGRRKRIVD